MKTRCRVGAAACALTAATASAQAVVQVAAAPQAAPPAQAAPAAEAPAQPQALAFHTPTTQIVITGTREKQTLAETPEAVGSVDEQTIRADRPTHPAQIMGQVPGVAVAVTNGEGHTTAIRQPFTTSPVYLYLEDGVPIRSTGFFNHNALYEIDIPASGGIEITKGPGTALYGSDAIGGIINVLTPTPPTSFEAYVSPDIGSFGWWRVIAGYGDANLSNAWRGDVNITHTDGWRDSTAYDRQGALARWDYTGNGGWVAKTTLAYSKVDQQTGANSPLIEDDYRHDPTKNYLPIAFRKVEAMRLTSAIEREFGGTLWSITPYVRDNSMDLLATFLLNSDPTIAYSSNKSAGFLAKYRQDFPDFMRARVIAGVDVDYSPGSRQEDRLNVNPTGSGASRVFDSYTVGPRVYDYDVDFQGVSPYLHTEISPVEALRLTAGVRHDSLEYTFDNKFDPTPIRVPGAFPGVRFYGQAEDTKKRFTHTTPKFGATYALTQDWSLYGSYHQGFRVPSEAQLFRPSAAASAAAAQVLTQSSLDLKPIRAEQWQGGVRGHVANVAFDAVVYRLDKRDDIVSFRDTATNFTQNVNAGHTRHEGVEIGASAEIVRHLLLDIAYSRARHTYVDWVTAQGNFSGKDIESAPATLANVRLTWSPLRGTNVTAEWVRIGSYWMDAANTTRYPGHDLVNVRGNWEINKRLALFGSITNAGDKRYADSASISSSTPVFSPGLPRAYYAGATFRW
jgi:iron complex outermembrane recepter protein